MVVILYYTHLKLRTLLSARWIEELQICRLQLLEVSFRQRLYTTTKMDLAEILISCIWVAVFMQYPKSLMLVQQMIMFQIFEHTQKTFSKFKIMLIELLNVSAIWVLKKIILLKDNSQLGAERIKYRWIKLQNTNLANQLDLHHQKKLTNHL